MNQKRNRENLEKMMLIILIGSLAIVLGIIEAMIPVRLPIPGAKLGLANIMIVIGLLFRWKRYANCHYLKNLFNNTTAWNIFDVCLWVCRCVVKLCNDDDGF